MFKECIACARLLLASLLICSVVYPAAIWVFAQSVTPVSADAGLVTRDGDIVGSRHIAQAFTQARYFWPRPSAVDYAADAAGGSNWSPTNPKIKARARDLVKRLSATPDRPVPADLVTASGSGLDPDISLAAARYQLPRVARARGMAASRIEMMIEQNTHQRWTTAVGGAPVVNVLGLNLALDRAGRGGQKR